MISCPCCSSVSTIPIIYGFPSDNLFQAHSRGLVELGGCVMIDDVPTRLCLDCDFKWKESMIGGVLDLETAKSMPVFNVDVLQLVQLRGPIKARAIAEILTSRYGESVSRRDVNSVLYKMEKEKRIEVNARYEWSLKD